MATITVTPGHTYDSTTASVTSTNLNNLGSPTAALTAGSILTADIADDNVTTAKIADDNVTTAKIADSNVTFAKLTDVIDDDTMNAATDTTLATSESIKAYVDNVSVFTKSFESAEQDIPAAGTPITFSHGMSSIPKIAQVVLRCKTAQFNYSIGDEIVIGDYGDAGQVQMLYFNTSTIGWGHMLSGSTILIKNRTTDANGFASSPNFKVVLKAFA